MFPIIFKLGPLTLHTYGLMVALGFLAGYTLSRRRFEIHGLPLAFYDQIIMMVMVSAIFGARFFYMALDGFAAFREDPLSFFRIWEGGLVYFGGFLGAVLALAIFAHWKELSLLGLSDAFAAPLLLSQAIGRLGCFAAGCCYGRPTDSRPMEAIFGVVFTNPDSLAPLGVRLHPTQLYSSLGDFILFLGMLQLEKKTSTQGVLTAFYLMGYGTFRFLIEFIRNDDRGPMVFHFFPSQWISLLAVLAGAALLIYVKKSKRA